MRAFVLSLAVVALAFVVPAQAGDANSKNWRIIQSVGEVELSSGGMFPVALDRKSDLEPGSVVKTGATGRVVLRRGEEQIVLKANSALTLTAASGRSTELSQESGTAVFSVDRKRVPHFEVKTPYFAALVKGTVFTVYVDSFGAKVSVREGAVEVSTPWREAVTLVEAGKSARVRAEEPGIIEMMAGNRVLRAVTGVDDSWSKRGLLRAGSDSLGMTRAGSAGNALENQDARIRTMVNEPIGQGARHTGSATMAGGPNGERIRGAAFVTSALDGATSVGAASDESGMASAAARTQDGGTDVAGLAPDAKKGDEGDVAAAAAKPVKHGAQDMPQKQPRKTLHAGPSADMEMPFAEILFATLALFFLVVTNHVYQTRRRDKEERRKANY
jgi:hypothetical protein